MSNGKVGTLYLRFTELELTVCVLFEGFKDVDVDSGRYNFEWNDKGNIALNESNFLGAKTSASFQDACTKEWGQCPSTYHSS